MLKLRNEKPGLSSHLIKCKKLFKEGVEFNNSNVIVREVPNALIKENFKIFINGEDISINFKRSKIHDTQERWTLYSNGEYAKIIE